MASKRKLKNEDLMSEPLFTQSPDEYIEDSPKRKFQIKLRNSCPTDNRRNHDPDSQPLDDFRQDYTCCDTEGQVVSDNSPNYDEFNLPDSQPLDDFTQASPKRKFQIKLGNSCTTDNRRNHDPDSQPLDNVTQDYTCCDTEGQPVSDKRSDHNEINPPDSQPLDDFTQADTCYDTELQSEKEYEKEKEDELRNKILDSESKIENKVRNMQQKATSCIHCIFDKELDKRNYYFGNLLIGELQFLPPCMRSEAYITILRYIDSLKKKHRGENI